MQSATAGASDVIRTLLLADDPGPRRIRASGARGGGRGVCGCGARTEWHASDDAADDATRKSRPSRRPSCESGDLLIGQTSAILLYLGAQHGLAPKDPAGGLWTHQIQLTIADLVNEAHDTHHPVGVGLYYEDQKDEALRRAEGIPPEPDPEVPRMVRGNPGPQSVRQRPSGRRRSHLCGSFAVSGRRGSDLRVSQGNGGPRSERRRWWPRSTGRSPNVRGSGLSRKRETHPLQRGGDFPAISGTRWADRAGFTLPMRHGLVEAFDPRSLPAFAPRGCSPSAPRASPWSCRRSARRPPEDCRRPRGNRASAACRRRPSDKPRGSRRR